MSHYIHTYIHIYVCVCVRQKVKVALKQATKAKRWGYKYSSTLFLTSALDGSGWSTPAAAGLPPEKIHCIGGWVGPRAGLDECGKSRPHRDSIPGPSPLLSHLPSRIPTKSNLNLANALQTAIRDLDLCLYYIICVTNLVPIFLCLGHSKRSVQGRGPV